MNDPTQLVALAALVGITGKTHWHLAEVQITIGGIVRALDNIDPDKLPALDTPEGDDVFLAPTMRWCKSKGLAPLVDGEYGPWNAMIQYNGLAEISAESPTPAIIGACQSAGVPEIVAIFGEGEK